MLHPRGDRIDRRARNEQRPHRTGVAAQRGPVEGRRAARTRTGSRRLRREQRGHGGHVPFGRKQVERRSLVGAARRRARGEQKGASAPAAASAATASAGWPSSSTASTCAPAASSAATTLAAPPAAARWRDVSPAAPTAATRLAAAAGFAAQQRHHRYRVARRRCFVQDCSRRRRPSCWPRPRAERVRHRAEAAPTTRRGRVDRRHLRWCHLRRSRSRLRLLRSLCRRRRCLHSRRRCRWK